MNATTAEPAKPVLTFTAAGQPAPYADSRWMGTVTGGTEQEARDLIQAGVRLGEIAIKDPQWWQARYDRFSGRIVDGVQVWEFHVTRPYLD